MERVGAKQRFWSALRSDHGCGRKHTVPATGLYSWRSDDAICVQCTVTFKPERRRPNLRTHIQYLLQREHNAYPLEIQSLNVNVIKYFLCIPWRHIGGGVEVVCSCTHTALDGGDCQLHIPAALPLGERATIKNELVGCLDLRACLDPVIFLLPEIEIRFVGRPASSLVTTLSRLTSRLMLYEEHNPMKHANALHWSTDRFWRYTVWYIKLCLGFTGLMLQLIDYFIRKRDESVKPKFYT
jgi:hypothetical protein